MAINDVKSWLTNIREAVWKSIDNNVHAKKFFTGRFRWDGSQPLRADTFEPPIGQLPAVSIFGAGNDQQWETNANQQYVYSLVCQCWTKEHNMVHGEDAWQVVWQALWQTPDNKNPYLFATTERRQLQITGATFGFKIINVDENGNGYPVTETTFQIQVPIPRNPRKDYYGVTE